MKLRFTFRRFVFPALLLALLITSAMSGQSQNSVFGDFGAGTKNDILNLKKEKVYLVIPNSQIGEALQSAVSNEWKFTKMETITETDAAKQFKDGQKGYFFGKFMATYANNDVKVEKYPVIGFMEKYQSANNYLQGKDFNIHILFPVQQYPSGEMEDKVQLDIRMLNFYCELLGDENNKIKNYEQYLKQIERNHRKCRTKVIFIHEDEYDADPDRFAKKFSGPIKAVGWNEIKLAIQRKEDVLIYRRVNSVKYQTNILVHAQTGEVYYYKRFSNLLDAGAAQEHMFRQLGKAK